MKIPGFEQWLRERRCYMCGRTPCDPHHCGKHGTAKRNHDEDAIPLCSGLSGCHRKFHDGRIKIPNIEAVIKMFFRAWLKTEDGKKWLLSDDGKQWEQFND